MIIRPEYHWNELWSGLMSLLRFTVHHLEELKERDEELNLFISAVSYSYPLFPIAFSSSCYLNFVAHERLQLLRNFWREIFT